MKTFLLFVVTALAEIAGCYLPWLWLRGGRSAWLLLPAAASLILFAWLLTLHPAAAGRVYAAYGGVYIGVAILWLWAVDGIAPPAGISPAPRWRWRAWPSSSSSPSGRYYRELSAAARPFARQWSPSHSRH